MIKYNNSFKFGDSYIPLNEVKLIEPYSIEHTTDNTVFTMNEETAKRLNIDLGLRSLPFSKQLYDHDNSLWQQLYFKRTSYNTIIDFKNSFKAMLINGEVVSVVDKDNYIVDFTKIIDKFTFSNVQNNYYYNYYNSKFMFMILTPPVNSFTLDVDHSLIGPVYQTGILIEYNLSNNWVKIINVLFDESKKSLFISPYNIISKDIRDDLDAILDLSTLVSSSNLIIHEFIDFMNNSKKTLTFTELFDYLKKDFDIKIKTLPINPNSVIKDNYPAYINDFLSNTISDIYSKYFDYVASSRLKRSINYSEITFYDYFLILSKVVFESNYDFSIYQKFILNVISKNTNFDQLV